MCRNQFPFYHSYIIAAGMDGGTQVVLFILNFVRIAEAMLDLRLHNNSRVIKRRPSLGPLAMHTRSLSGGVMVCPFPCRLFQFVL